MSEKHKPTTLLSGDYQIPKGKIAIITTKWNEPIVSKLYNGAIKALKNNGISDNDIITLEVPGSFELPLAAKWIVQQETVVATLCLGCVIQGETRHAEYISASVAQGLIQVSLESSKPVIFGVLTPNNMDQAHARSGGEFGNKGSEAAESALLMLNIKQNMTRK